MNVLAAALLVGAIVVAAFLVRPSARRTGLGIWHPAYAWLALHALFFAVGSAFLALDDRIGPALYVGGAALALGSAVALSDGVARRRSTRRDGASAAPGAPAEAPGAPGASGDAPLRPVVVAGLAAAGVALVLPTLVKVGLPILAQDITGARIELAGPTVQVLRVTVPALVLTVVLWGRRRPAAWLLVAALVALEIGLASRYLAAELLAVLLVGLGLAGWRLRGRLVLAAALIAIVAFGTIQVLRAYDQAAGRELAFAFERTVNRVVLVQPRTLEALQVTIPAEQPYFGGLTWLRRLGPELGRPDIPNLGYWIYPRLFPGQDTAGYAAPGLIGEAWANFGPFGIALFALLGLAIERLGAFLGRRRLATGDLIAGSLAVVFLARTHALGLNGLGFLLLLVVVWRVLAAGGLRATMATLGEAVRWRT